MRMPLTPPMSRQPRQPRQHRLPLARQRGLSLIEIMVALTIGFVLMLGLSVLMSEQSRDRSEIDKAGRQIDNGRQAIALLTDDIQLAGYFGEFSGSVTALTSLPDPCELSNMTTISAGMAMPIQGYDAPSSGSQPTCLSSSNVKSGTDVLVIRRAATAVTASGSLTSGLIYLQSNPNERVIALGQNTGSFTLVKKDTVTAADIRKYMVIIYYVSPCNTYASGSSVCTAGADNGSPIPTLKRLEINVASGSAVWNTVSLVEGIENMQLDYGVDSGTSGVPDTPSITAPSVAQWPNVMQVTVNLLARNNEQSAGHTDTKTYSMGLAGSVGAFNDRYKRHIYAATVRVMNLSQRRE